MESEQPRKARLSSTGNVLSLFSVLKHVKHFKWQCLPILNVGRQFLPSLDMYANFLTRYLSRSAKIWNFVHARISCF